MDDEVAVRVMHGLADLPEKDQALTCREAMIVAVPIDWYPLDMLHHEVGGAVFYCAAVEEPRDIRVIECREDLPFLRQALREEAAGHVSGHQLDCHLLLIYLVGSRCQVHHARRAQGMNARKKPTRPWHPRL